MVSAASVFASVDSAFVSAGADTASPEQAASDMVIIDTSAAHYNSFFHNRFLLDGEPLASCF